MKSAHQDTDNSVDDLDTTLLSDHVLYAVCPIPDCEEKRPNIVPEVDESQ